jgi:hypothetical protein
MGRKVVELVTRAEYARRRGCSEAAVHKAIEAGRISLIGDKIDPAVADVQWRQNTRARTRNANSDSVPNAAPGAGAGRGASDTTGGYADARARREHAEAELAEMEAATMRRSLVLRSDVDRGIFEAGREFRDRLTSCASRMAAEVAGLATADACHAVIEREHREALEQMAKAVREKLGPSPTSSEPAL